MGPFQTGYTVNAPINKNNALVYALVLVILQPSKCMIRNVAHRVGIAQGKNGVEEARQYVEVGSVRSSKHKGSGSRRFYES